MIKILVCIYKEEDKAILESLLPEDVTIEWDPEYISSNYNLENYKHYGDEYKILNIGVIHHNKEIENEDDTSNKLETEIKSYFLKVSQNDMLFNSTYKNEIMVNPDYPVFFELLDKVKQSKINYIQFIFEDVYHHGFLDYIMIFQEGSISYLKRLLFNFHTWKEIKINLFESGPKYLVSPRCPLVFRVINNE